MSASDSGRIKALVCRQLGDPLSNENSKTLQLTTDYPRQPEVLSGSLVRIRVVAAALNFADALRLQGLYQERAKLPFVPGSEVSGKVIEIGRDVHKLKVGDLVCAVSSLGGFAEEVVVSEHAVYRLPPNVDVPAAAGLPIAFGTAYLALRDRAHLQPKQTVLVLGAAGGVGAAAVQISKVLGASVIAVARGQSKSEILKELGADVVIDTSKHSEGSSDLKKLIKAAAPQGIDVLFDPVGGPQFNEALKCVKWGAHVLFIGFASGNIPQVAANIALVKNLTLHGVFWGSYMTNDPRVLRQGLQQLVTWLGEDKIVVPVSHRYSFEEATEAFKVLLSRQAVGKVILMPAMSASKL